MDRKKLVRARKAANEPGGLVQKTVAKTVGKIPFTKNRQKPLAKYRSLKTGLKKTSLALGLLGLGSRVNVDCITQRHYCRGQCSWTQLRFSFSNTTKNARCMSHQRSE